MAAVRIIGKSQRVVDAPGLTIDELAGNVASKEDRISIAFVVANKGTAEPFLTLHYDEWICVKKGKILFENDGGNVTAAAGDTVFIKEGTRFRPSFLEDSEYIPVCLPAFRPDRCIREDGENQEGQNIAENLKQLHKAPEIIVDSSEDQKPEILYHMTTKAEWEKAKAENHAYYPKTFEADGLYTHATGVPSRLIETANHFYQDVSGDWICLQFRRSILRSKFGIAVKDEAAMPVGEKQVSGNWEEEKNNWICPHVYGGIPLDCVEKVYKMVRDGPKFLSIEGVC